MCNQCHISNRPNPLVIRGSLFIALPLRCPPHSLLPCPQSSALSFCRRETDSIGTPVPWSTYSVVAIIMSNAHRRRRDEGRSPRRRAESLGAERHYRGHDRGLVPGPAHSAASRKRPSSPLGVYSSSNRVYVLTWLVGIMGMGRGRVSAQYVDGGKVSMECEPCFCHGSSDDGTINVFRSPSSNDLVRAGEWVVACETERERRCCSYRTCFVVISIYVHETYDDDRLLSST